MGLLLSRASSDVWLKRPAGGAICRPRGITVSWSHADDTVERFSRPTPKSAANPQRPKGLLMKVVGVLPRGESHLLQFGTGPID